MFFKPFWFHEDDYNRAQFLPRTCWNYCCDQLDRIHAHSVERSGADGIGWTRMYSIPPGPATVAELGIPAGELRAAMPWRLSRIGRVTTGSWSGEPTVRPRMAAYRAGHSALVMGWDESRIVDSLWFLGGGISAWHRGPLFEAFFRIGTIEPMLLVDWRGALIDLSDRRAIRRYLREA